MYYKYICIQVQIVKIKKITNICHVHTPTQIKYRFYLCSIIIDHYDSEYYKMIVCF